jgi:curli biogenesis system outer membrane secretion channel CsgG
MKTIHNSITVSVVLALGLALAPLAHAASSAVKPTSRTKTTDDAAKSAMPPAKGIKHPIGVVDFENERGFYSHMRMSENMRAMLESALHGTGRFIIVERGNLDAVALEQDLQGSDRAARATDVAQTGRLRSARYLAAGTITEASDETSGKGAGVNIAGVRLGGSVTKAQVVVMMKLIDTTTGEVVASERIRGEAGRTAVNVGYAGHDVGGDLGTFTRTPIGEASQDCINQAVKFVASKMEDFSIEGVVVAISGEDVIINMGENYGVQTGQTFIARKPGETLTDPGTGEVLDRTEGEVTGTLQVTRVREKTSYCKVVDGSAPERGDAVIAK